MVFYQTFFYHPLDELALSPLIYFFIQMVVELAHMACVTETPTMAWRLMILVLVFT